MLAFAVVLTLVDGTIAGLLAVGSATLSLWFFNTPPARSFALEHNVDAVALLAAGLVQVGIVLLLSVMAEQQNEISRRAGAAEAAFDAQRRAILVMQFALLPETMPAVMGVTIGWHYQPGGDTSNPIGGDWLALVPIANDRVGIAVGDVAGHGLEAVRDMAQYRFALRTLAAQGAAPTIVMAAVDDLARKFNIPYFSTCAYGIIDTTKETWLYSVAGHPPPFLLRAAQPQLLDGPHGPPLAAPGTAGNYREHVVPLKDGDLLALYSDGLIERRGESLSKGMERLGERLGAVGSHDDLSAASRAVVADLVGDASSDDVVIILARYKTAATTSAC